MLILVVVSVVRADETIADNPLTRNNPELLRALRALVQSIEAVSCTVNICFVIQSDDFVTNLEFETLKNFLKLIVTIFQGDSKARFCAVQYGPAGGIISPLTEKDDQFLRRVDLLNHIGKGNISRSDALNFADFQLRTTSEGENKIIIIEESFRTTAFPRKEPWTRIGFRSTKICGILIGGFDSPSPEDIPGYYDLVVRIVGLSELANTVVELISHICGFFKA